MKFRDLPDGAHFRFVDVPRGQPLKKSSARCYVRVIKDVVARREPGKSIRAMISPVCFTSLPRQDVIPTGRRSPVRVRKGRGRGSPQLGRYPRRRRR